MRNFQDILQNLKPLISWRSWWRRGKRGREAQAHPAAQNLYGTGRVRKPTLPRPERRTATEWQALEDSRLVRQAFRQFREFMYHGNRRTKQAATSSPRAVWEAGKLTDGREYFFLQAWNDRGYLFEETPRGWVVARADKILALSQFVRDRTAWDFVILHAAADRPGLLRVRSEQMGESLVSLRLYEDFMSQALQQKLDDTADEPMSYLE